MTRMDIKINLAGLDQNQYHKLIQALNPGDSVSILGVPMDVVTVNMTKSKHCPMCVDVDLMPTGWDAIGEK